MGDEHIRTFDATFCEQRMQLAGKLLRLRGVGPGRSAEAGAVVGADARRRRDLGLNRAPVEGERPQAGIEHHRWAALPDAVQMQAIAADIHQLSRRWIALTSPAAMIASSLAPPNASSTMNASSPSRIRTIQKTKRFGRRQSCGDETVPGGGVIVSRAPLPKYWW